MSSDLFWVFRVIVGCGGVLLFATHAPTRRTTRTTGTRMDRHWLAADFFLIAHDEFSGKLRISLELLCCGLVGGQLADLIVANRLAVQGGRLLVTDDWSEVGDEVGD